MLTFSTGRALALALLGLVLGGGLQACAPRTPSGVYVSAQANSVSMLQLIEGQDGSIAGSLQTLTLDGQGRIGSRAIQLTGSVDGENLNLTNVARWYEGSVTLSGRTLSHAIQLTVVNGSNVSTFEMQRSSIEKFSQQCEELRLRGEQIEADLARQREAMRLRAETDAFRRTIPTLSDRLQQVASIDAVATARINAAATQFLAYTSQMRDLLAERRREGDTARGSQLEVAMIQIEVGTTQLRLQVQQAQREFEQDKASLRRTKSEADEWCERTRDRICARLSSASTLYAASADQLAQAFTRAEAASRHAQAEQQALRQSVN